MKIMEVSEKYNIPTATLRYYERIGIIPPVNRNKSGIRDYTEQDCAAVEFAQCMRSITCLPRNTLLISNSLIAVTSNACI